MTAIRRETDLPLSEAIVRAFMSSQSALFHTAIDDRCVAYRFPDDTGQQGLSDFPRLRDYQAAKRERPTYERPTRNADCTVQEIRRFRNYGHGWNGYQAERPKPDAIRDACDLVGRLIDEHKFAVSAEPDGTMNLTLDGATRRLTFAFEGDGFVQVLARVGSIWEDQGSYPIAGRPGLAPVGVLEAIAHSI